MDEKEFPENPNIMKPPRGYCVPLEASMKFTLYKSTDKNL
jgi:hypothetical protein